MGLLGRLFRSLYYLPSSDDDPSCHDLADRRNQLSLTLSFRHANLRLDIGSSVRPDNADHTSSATDPISVSQGNVAGDPHQPWPPRTPDAEQQSRADDYGVPRQRQHASEIPRRREPATASFWDALDPTEREALRAVAFLRTFAAGATIMHEGEPADHVIVILGGKVRICVDDNGRQRVLAERGLGELVGERGALQVSVRSATVIALEMVWALVAQTKDFAVFVSAHPRVLSLVQDQRYDRGTDEPTGYERGHGEPASFRARPTYSTTTRQPDGFTAGNPHPLHGENCTVILTDVVAFGARTRTDRDRLIIREALSMMTYSAMHGIPDVWSEDRGDGTLMVIPPDVPTARVLEQVIQELLGALDQHNTNHDEPASFQLRLAINVGPVVSDRMGVSGEAIIVAARLVEAPAFKEALARSTANLGVIASPFVYEAVIRHGKYPNYSPVPVEVKESLTTAWMKFFDTPVSASVVPHRAASA